MSKYFIFIPNLLSIVRIGLVYPILNNIFIGNFVVSLGYFLVASLTDALDGFLARKMKWQTYLGTLLDPIADKILIVFLLIAVSINLASYYVGFLSAFIITREIWVGALRDFNARQNRSEATKVTFLAKIKTTTQLVAISTYLLGLALSNMLIVLIADILLFLSFLVTIYTGIQYTNNTFYKKK